MMPVPKTILEHAEEYERLELETEKLFAELERYAKDHVNHEITYTGFSTTSFPSGDRQPGGFFLDTDWAPGEDSGSGSMYLPVQGSKRYLCATFEF